MGCEEEALCATTAMKETKFMIAVKNSEVDVLGAILQRS
jgi:hypothetical protein